MQSFGNYLMPCVLLLLTLSANAQPKGYEQGYIITLQRDTVPGWVKDRSPEPFVELYNRIRFRPMGKSSRKKYSPGDILGYRAGNREYVSIQLREESAFFRFRYYLDPQADQIFLRVIRQEGTLTWYEQEFVHDDNDYLDSFPLFHRQGSREMVRVTQGILGLKRERLSDYFQECPKLVQAVTDKKLNEVAEVYGFYLSQCAVGGAGNPDEDSFEGTWTLDPGPAPDAPPYFQNFLVERISGNGFEGTFYSSRTEEGRLRRKGQKLYFAFTTRDPTKAFYHSGYFEAGVLHGVTYCPDLKSVTPWKGTRE